MIRYLFVLALALLSGKAQLGVKAQSESIAEIAAGNPDFSTLVTALGAAGFGLDCKRFCFPVTAFAPTNDAFTAGYSEAELEKLLNPDYGLHLQQVLLYHLVYGRVFAADLENGEVMTVGNENVVIDLTGTDPMVNDAKITSTDIPATNGLIHVIDKALRPPVVDKNIADVATEAGTFAILIEALERTGLVAALTEEGPITVFAPTDDAFAKLGISLDDLDNDTLTNILLYHVISGSIIERRELDKGPTPVTLQGSSIDISYKGFWWWKYVELNDSTRVDAFNVLASNGIIHVIDSVLVPPDVDTPLPTIAEIATGEDSLSTLVTALTVADLVDVFSTPEGGPFTVFAPTNSAFERVPGLDLILADTDLLTTVLQYHVVEGKVLSTDLEDGPVPTLAGPEIDVDVRFRHIVLNGNTFVKNADIEASNGVVHTINKVLVPPADLVTVAKVNGYGTLVAALEATGLDSVLQTDSEFTVFAPTDEAFAALGQDRLDQLLTDEIDTLTEILRYHVVSGAVPLRALREGDVETVQGESIDVDFRYFLFFWLRGVTLNGNSDIKKVDLEATNGFIHEIDSILVPPSLSGR